MATSPSPNRLLGIALACLIAAAIGAAVYLHASHNKETAHAPVPKPGAPALHHLNADAIGRIRTTLQSTPGLTVEVGGLRGDPKSLSLAAELRTVFTGDVFKVHDVAEYELPSEVLEGVSIYSKPELNQVLSDAVAQIFSELGQPKIQWIPEDIVGQLNPGEPTPEIRVMVGQVELAEAGR